ncbi:MAG: O-antigen ligase family protein [Armatimonadota bacterium]|nr:O-antigen ligase family protein [Armatimonadota bacterium]
MGKGRRRQSGNVTAATRRAEPAYDAVQLARFIGLIAMMSVVLLAFWTGSQDGAKIKTTIFYIGTVVLAAAWFVPELLKGEIAYVRSRILAPAVATLVLSGISMLIFPYKETIWSEFGRRIVYVLLFLVVIHSITSREQLRWFARAALVTAALISLYGMLQHFGRDLPGMHWSEKANVQLRVFSSLLNATYLAAYLAMLIPPAVACFIASRGLVGRVLVGAVILCMQIALMWTWTRGAWFGLAAGLAISLAALAWLAGRSGRLSGIWKPLLVAALLIVFGTAAGSYRSGVVERAKSVAAKDLSNVQRTAQWRAAWAVFKDHPALGVGVGATTIYVPPNLTPAFYATSRDVVSGHPHNEYLEVLAESGVIGGVLFVWLLIAIGATGLGVAKRAAKAGDVEIALAATGLLAGVVAFLVANVGGLTMRCTYGGMLFWAALGLLVVCDRLLAEANAESPNPAVNLRLPLPAKARGGMALVIVAIIVLVSYYSCALLVSDVHLGRGGAHLAAGDWQDAIEDTRTAIRYNPCNVLAYYKLANALYMGREYRQSLAACKKVMRFAPDYARIHNYTAAVYLALGPKYYESALAQVRRQIKIDGLPGSYAQLSKIQEAMGDIPAALASLRRGLADLKVAPDGDLRLWSSAAPRLIDLQVKAYPGKDPANDLVPYIPRGKYAAGMRLALGRHYMSKKDWPRAEEQFRLAVEANPDEATNYDHYGLALFEQRRYAQALSVYQSLCALLEGAPGRRDEYVGALMNLAANQAQLGNYRAAVATWNKVIGLAPGSPAAEQARRFMYRIQ